jgi:expansin (peptidoglycan-binding protein)
MTLCGSSCVDTNTDPANCGGCNSPCATTCMNGVCQLGTMASCKLPTGYQSGNGSVTFYSFSQGSAAVNCSYAPIHVGADVNAAQGKVTDYDTVPHVSTGGGADFGAMNTADYANAATCGACAEITRDGSRKVVVTIVDQCPTGTNSVCKAGHIDLSWHAFQQLGTFSEGYLGTGNGGAAGSISWRYVPCPVTENVSLVVKQPNTGPSTFNQVLVQGHRAPLTKVEVSIGGNFVNAVRQSYNYWDPGTWPAGTYTVRATDTAGDQITGTIDLGKSGDQATTAQFPTCL